MARLNEPAAASTESIDSLKRKFMRQNRDIARANSTQSLRIRSLENEVSRLLSENLGLREQVARLQGEMENGRAQRALESTQVLKTQLEAKLLELGALVAGLGEEAAPRKKSSPVGKTTRNSSATSPDQKNWKNLCTLSEAVGGQEGRLPPILENKSYPRKTLEREEILNLVSDNAVDTTDSPDIGPPPVSQFVDEDPVKIDLPKRTRKDDREDLTGLDPALSVNLEQRRKRKDSTGSLETRKPSKDDEAAREAAVALKAGAKRKLNVREDEDTHPKTDSSSPDDFKFTRTASEERGARNKSQPRSEKLGVNSRKENTASTIGTQEKNPVAKISTRKILAPKSVNNSPRKTLKSLATEDLKSTNGESIKQDVKERSRERKQESVQIPPPAQPIMNTVDLQVEPETPAALNLFSPLSSHPSTARIESRDTPPPPDLNTGSDAQRPNRRARGAVSYAEPNLRDKMRRPTKDLVDAVARDAKATRENTIKVEDGVTQDSVTIKPEPEADDAWKQMPTATAITVENSPLSSKVAIPELLPNSITTHRKRRESILAQVDLDSARPGSATAIAALLAETRKAKAAVKDKGTQDEAAITKGIGKLDIYEFRGSAPTSDEPSKESPKPEKTVAPRVSRRQIPVTRDAQPASDGEVSDFEAAKRSDSAASRRRQSTLGVRSSSTSSLHLGDHGSERLLKRSTSTTAVPDPVTATAASTSTLRNDRNERISARRRSMMI